MHVELFSGSQFGGGDDVGELVGEDDGAVVFVPGGPGVGGTVVGAAVKGMNGEGAEVGALVGDDVGDEVGALVGEDDGDGVVGAAPPP